ncbi:MAG: hypothetical protein M3463_10920 [Verrucomicrobiota bacterium]|nr:hypothetical protein [Verrucomicrobiota bacterium]
MTCALPLAFAGAQTPRLDPLQETAPTEKLAAAVRPLAALLEDALAAYNAGDAQAFFRHAANSATPAPTPETFRALFEGVYRAQLGNFETKRLLAAESVPDPNHGLLVYEARFEKHPWVRLSANFTREAEALKLVQIRMEKIEPEK